MPFEATHAAHAVHAERNRKVKPMSPSLVGMLYGGVLVGLAVAGYLAVEPRSATALMPAGLGALVLVLSLVARLKPGLRHHMMHAVSVLLLLALAGTAWRLIVALSKEPVVVSTTSILAAIVVASAVALAVMVRSFIAAAKARRAAEAAQGPAEATAPSDSTTPKQPTVG